MLCNPSVPNTIDQARTILQKCENVTVNPTFPEVRSLIGRAFGGKRLERCEPMMAYMLKALGELSDKERQEMAGFCLGFFAYETLKQKGGLAVGIRDDEDGPLRAVAIFREYDPAKENHKANLLDKIRFTLTGLRAFFAMKYDSTGLPGVLDDRTKNKEFQKASGRLTQPMLDMMHNWHCQYAPREKHWYVAIVATDPGNGYGKQVMNLLGQVADQTNMACYLECPDYNRYFYEKVGYSVTKPIKMSLQDKVLGDFSNPGYLMTRDCMTQGLPN